MNVTPVAAQQDFLKSKILVLRQSDVGWPDHYCSFGGLYPPARCSAAAKAHCDTEACNNAARRLPNIAFTHGILYTAQGFQFDHACGCSLTAY